MKRLLSILVVLFMAVGLFAAGQSEKSSSGTSMEMSGGPMDSGIAYKAPINIGTKNFTEQYVAGNLLYLYLKDKGFDVNLKTGMSSTVLREAMENGDIDLCMEYTGTQWLTYTGHEFKGASPEEMYDQVARSDAQQGLVWLDPIWCNNTYAIAVTKDFSEANNVKTLSDFAAYVKEKDGEVKFASDFEFYARPDGVLGLQLHYDFAFKPDYITTVAPGLTFEYLASGRADATMVFGTDPQVIKYDWVVLQDDKNFWPPYDLAPYTRKEVLDANPGLGEALEELVAAFPDEPAEARSAMQEINALVDINKMEPEEAAKAALEQADLIGS